ncbi:MAG: LLM class F420-dependent oxidoreductase [Gaiellaceae bacterium]
MEIGIAMFPTDYAVAPAELARLVEERGFDSLWFPEHTHIPANRRTPYPGGGELPPEYSHTHDPFVALAAVATATERLRFGTGICLIVERDPITTAKEVASLDFLSGGRFLFGVGAGWNREEMENHGTDPRRRFSLMRERVEAMKAIWTEEEAGYQGQHVNFDPVWSWPKPAHRPHPPVMIGGAGEKVLDRVISFGDGWLPQPPREKDLVGRMAELRRRAEEAGKDVAIVPFDHRSKPQFAEEMRQLGADGCVFWIPPEGRDETEARLDRIAERLGEFVGAAAA